MNIKKYILIILVCFISLQSFATNWYFSPTGNNATGDGSIGSPWFSISGLSSPNNYARFADPGDTVFFRGGTYNYTTKQQIDEHGAQGNEIVFMAYPGETPVFDFYTWDWSENPPNYTMIGFYMANATTCYLKFQGLHVRRVWKINTDNGRAHGFNVDAGVHHITFDRCKVDSIAGYGFQSSGEDIFYYNCDAWWCADPQDEDPGNAGFGFSNTGGDGIDLTMNDTVLYQNCRAWLCADQGFYGMARNFTIYENCWTFSNGIYPEYPSGSGHGFKFAHHPYDIESVAVKIINCLSVYNWNYGFHENNDGAKPNIRVYNNLAAYNGNSGFFSGYAYTSLLDNEAIYRNNIAYGHPVRPTAGYDFWDENGLTVYGADHAYNSWDLPYYDQPQTRHMFSPATVNDADFIAVPDSATNFTVMSGARGEDGSLPDLGDYWHLAEGSDLIDAGIALGSDIIPYDGDGNYRDYSLGAFSYLAVEPEPPEYPQVTTVSVSAYNSFRATTGGSGIITPEGTIAAKGVCWSTSINPTIADSKTNEGTGTDDYTSEITGLSSGTTYHIRAYVTDGAAQTSYGADVPLTTPSVNYFQSGGKFLYDPATGKFIKR